MGHGIQTDSFDDEKQGGSAGLALDPRLLEFGNFGVLRMAKAGCVSKGCL